MVRLLVEDLMVNISVFTLKQKQNIKLKKYQFY